MFKAIITECSKELSNKEKLQYSDYSNAIAIDTLPDNTEISVANYAVLNIHNDKSENTDYTVYMVEDKVGQKYYTSSESFFSTFKGYWDGMQDSDEEWGIQIFKKESKNYKGKGFITCTIV